MLNEARSVFEVCPKLIRVGIMEGKCLKAVRCMDGTVEDVVLDFGPGMLVGRDNQAFLD